MNSSAAHVSADAFQAVRTSSWRRTYANVQMGRWKTLNSMIFKYKKNKKTTKNKKQNSIIQTLQNGVFFSPKRFQLKILH